MMHGGRGHNILLVDDEEMFLSSLFDGLRRRFPDFTFRTANNGEMALAQLDKQPADLVITDLKMPKMDGFQLIAAMHSQYPAIPLLIMTAHSTELSEGRAMASGALHCIDKPVDLAELARRIDELFSTGAIASLRGVSLAAFLQLLGLEKKSGIVDVQGDGVRARLYLSSGQVIHADNGAYTGLQAALRTVGLDDVEIHFRPGAVPKTPTIDLPLTQLLLDSARMRDEGERDAIQDLDLAFSESFSEAFDEQLDALGGGADKEAAPAGDPLGDPLGDALGDPLGDRAGDAQDAADERDDPKVRVLDVTDSQIQAAITVPPQEEIAAALAAASAAYGLDEPAAPDDGEPEVLIEPALSQTAVSGDIEPSRVNAAPTAPIAIEPSVDVNWDAVPEPSPDTAKGTRPNSDGAAPLAAKPADPSAPPPSAAVRNPLRELISRPVAAPPRRIEAASPRPSTALPIPRAASSLPAAARAAVLTPPISRPALPRPPGMPGGSPVPSVSIGGRPRTPTPAVPTYSAEANVSDSVASCLRKIGEIGGVLGAAFLDFQSGETLGSITREASFDTAAMARANIDVVRAKLALLETLGLHDVIEDIIITTRRQYHVLCMSPRRPRQFVFIGLARDHATLALARFLIDEAIQSASPGGMLS